MGESVHLLRKDRRVSHTGRIFQINASHGGVPKLPLHTAVVTSLGLEMDHQDDREHHGGPDRALCLYSLERILELQAEGHPIYPGSTGENLTLSGLDWSRIVPGTRLYLGEHVVVEVTHETTPCPKIAGSFAGGQIYRISQEQYPGWSRVYARVISTGTICIGDDVNERDE
jgi:MOSC domain-containing protein YiiM